MRKSKYRKLLEKTILDMYNVWVRTPDIDLTSLVTKNPTTKSNTTEHFEWLIKKVPSQNFHSTSTLPSPEKEKEERK